MRRFPFYTTLVLFTTCAAAAGDDWTQFRGRGGLGISDASGAPIHWSSQENVVWTTALPGPGTSSPIVLGDRIYLTCYTGYGLEPSQGDVNDLKRHLLCIDRKTGDVLWSKEFQPRLPEHNYQGEGSYHGYASSTPTTDGERLYVFFGKSGVFCFDLDGNQLWHAGVGSGTSGWGSGCSPLLYKELLIVNASVESGALIALDKRSGKEIWRSGGIRASWNTPLLVGVDGRHELAVSIADQVLGLDPATGENLWQVEGIHRYVCPSLVAHDGIIYAIGGGHTSLAVRAGGRGDVNKTHNVWRSMKGSNVSSPLYHDGNLYWASDSRGIVYCQDASTGRFVYERRLMPESGLIYASPILAGGNVYYVSQRNGTFVVAAKPEFELVAHNAFDDDSSRTNASPVVSRGQLFLRSDGALYCIGKPASP